MEHNPDGICVHRHGRVLYVNDAGVRLMLARSSDEIVGRPIAEFVASESIPPMLTGLAELREVGDCTPAYPAQMIRIDGSLLAVEVVSVMTVWEDEVAYQVVTRDVTARHSAHAAMRYQAALVNHVSDAIIATTETGLVTSWNPAAETIYGRSVDEALGFPIAALVGADVDPVAIVASGGNVHTTHHSASGAALDVRVSAAAMGDGYVFVCCDLTALHRAEQHFEAVVESMAEGVIVTDKDGFIKSINPAAMEIIGAGPEHLGGDFFAITGESPFYDAEGVNIPPDLRPALAVLRTGVPFFNEVFGKPRPNGQRGWLMSSCRLLNPDMPGQSDMLMTFTDITRQRAAADRMVFWATHDELTKLPNRASVLRRINKALAAPHGYRLVAVLFIDIDGLKTTNDTLGHPAGDDLLCATAERLRRAVADADIVGRLGGDEFVVLVCGDATRRELDDVVGRVRLELATPAVIGGTSTEIRASIGVVEVADDEQRTADEILRDADLAMYEAKRARRGRGS